MSEPVNEEELISYYLNDEEPDEGGIDAGILTVGILDDGPAIPMPRQDVANAATIAGITNITPYYRQSLKVGDGFVRLASLSRDDSGFGWVSKWEIWIATPTEFVAAETWIDTNLIQVLDAINTVALAAEATPTELIMGTNSVNGIIIVAYTAD